MAIKESLRPGGRSARVQTSVHQAVKDLLGEVERSELTIPAVAARAGVTPSTIYRRWGTLQDLLADVAVERLRPDGEPADTGSARGDLDAWLEQFVDEMASAPGRAMTRDVLACTAGAAPQCSAFTRRQIETIAARAAARGEPAVDIDAVMDHVVAPIVYRIMFDESPPGDAYRRALLDRVRPAGR
ncbi:MAG: TetR/AcrR family transcriptional regulator [Rhodoplanes sp.]|uniref:TetR/AcrR family transcriptional regulator n=1 Tax=Rhodoplanes sp. TaxID=1968906 RepID=UPI00182EB03C|nr:TetR/AcrR family transcriptional regulator [Rhodoplanes sp.]NVO16796.1 TetR/AcrR family transcriptional regulator [Rhodoplanes sp.]